jgi:hypothetical protein
MPEYTNAQYVAIDGQNTAICVDINGVPSFVPIDPANTDYANMMVLVAKGKLVIAPAA